MIGAIADDFTGGTDVAVAFRRAGLRTVMLFGTPSVAAELPEHDAVVIALKSRTIEPVAAVSQSLEAAAWLREHGVDQYFFKYCSTFDSRPEGNIGPVADALADFLGAPVAAVVPSSPEHNRTQYMGTLFVDRQPLAESPMRNHPLTPMRDSSIVRVLESQTSRAVSLIDHRDVRLGRERIRALLDAAAASGVRYAVVDAVGYDDLREIGFACVDDVLVTGAAGLAEGLGIARVASRPDRDRSPGGGAVVAVGSVDAAVLAGSCSARTLEQIAHMRIAHDSFRLDAVATPDAQELADAALAWFDSRRGGRAPLIYSSLPDEELRAAQAILGVDRASAILEQAMGLIARGLVQRGVLRLVVAGGETSGAVVTALDVDGGVIGDEAAPGVPWIYTTGQQPIALLLKSGNFGDVTLLARAVDGDAGSSVAA